ncbi:MAG: glycosyltransferase, partial [Candidatus Moraniibacteriota bacterium]
MNNNKKILIVTPFFYPAWSYGGPPRVMFDLCSCLVEDGYEVTVATTDVLDKNRCSKSEDAVNGIRIKYFKNASNTLAYKLKVFLPKGLKRYLKENIKNFDIVHIVDFRNSCTYYAYHECIEQNIPYIITPFGTMPYTNGLKGIVKRTIDKTWGIECLKKARCVVVQTENEQTEAVKLGVAPEKISLIPLMIDAKKFRIDTDTNVREKFSIPLSAKIILFVGRINEHKATDNMLLSAAKLINENPTHDFRLLIVGRDDGYENQLRKLSKQLKIEGKIIFAGPVFYPDTVAIYKSSDVFFMAPTHFEETSTASLEALASGIPVVVTKQADIPFFDKYKAGFIVENNIEELATALEKVLINDDYRKKDCVNIIEDHFDLKSIE